MASHRPNWSISLGRWGGIDVRIHGSFLLALILLTYWAWRESAETSTPLVGLAAWAMVLWFASVLVHELAAILMIGTHAGDRDQILLGPLGGLRRVPRREFHSSELVAAVAGPMASLALLLIGLAFSRWHAPTELVSLLQPPSLESFLEDPEGAHVTLGLAAMRLLVCINGWIFLTNIIPAVPFDAGRGTVTILQHPRTGWDHRRASLWVCVVSRGIAFVMLVLAIAFHEADPGSLLPTWFVLILLSMSIFYCARAEESQLLEPDSEDDPFGYDFSQGYTSLEKHEPTGRRRRSLLRGFLVTVRRQWRMRRARLEAAEDQQVDSILAKLNEVGVHGLTSNERAILKRASTRYRNRLST